MMGANLQRMRRGWREPRVVKVTEKPVISGKFKHFRKVRTWKTRRERAKRTGA